MKPMGRLVSFALALCLTGNAFLVNLPRAQAAPRVQGKFSIKAVLDAASGHSPRFRVSPEMVALAGNSARFNGAVKAALVLSLIRLARVFLTKPRLAEGPSDLTDAERKAIEEAMAPMFSPDKVADYGFEFAEGWTAFTVAGRLEAAMAAKYGTMTLSKSLATRLASFGPVFLVWATSNHIHKQIREGRYEDGITRAVLADLVQRVGKDVLAYLAISLGARILTYGWTALKGVALGSPVVARVVASPVGAICAKLGGLASAVLGVAVKVVIIASIAYAVITGLAYVTRKMGDKSDREGRLGMTLEYSNQLEDVLRHHAAKGTPMEKVFLSHFTDPWRVIHAYNTSAVENDPWVDSKAEMLLRLCELNNAEATKLYEKISENLRDQKKAQDARDAGEVKDLREDEQKLREKLRNLFYGDGGRSWLSGGRKIREVEALRAEGDRLNGIARDEDNTMVRTADDAVFEAFLTKYAEHWFTKRANPYATPGQAQEPTAEQKTRIRDQVADFLKNRRSERLLLKQYVEKRLAQIEDIAKGPTLQEAVLQNTLLEGIFKATKELFEETRLGRIIAADERDDTPADTGFDSLITR